MKKIKNNYTNFILTVIAVAMIGILFKGEIVKEVNAHSTSPGSDHYILTLVEDNCIVNGRLVACTNNH